MKKLKGITACSRNVILSVNTILMVVTLAMVGLGVAEMLGSDILERAVRDICKPFSSSKILALDDFDNNKFDFDLILGGISKYVMTFGIVAFTVSAIGLLGAKKTFICITVPYTCIMGAILLVQVIGIILVVLKRNMIDRWIKPPLISNIQTSYIGYNETDITSQTWSLLMIELSCCGVDGYEDFVDASLWRRQVYQDGYWFTLQTPLVCCVLTDKDPGDFSCAVNPSVYTSHFQKGCYDRVWNILEENKIFTLGFTVLLLTVQMALFVSGLIFSIKICIIRRKEKREKKDNSEQTYIGSPKEDDQRHTLSGYGNSMYARTKDPRHCDSRHSLNVPYISGHALASSSENPAIPATSSNTLMHNYNSMQGMLEAYRKMHQLRYMSSNMNTLNSLDSGPIMTPRLAAAMQQQHVLSSRDIMSRSRSAFPFQPAVFPLYEQSRTPIIVPIPSPEVRTSRRNSRTGIPQASQRTRSYVDEKDTIRQRNITLLRQNTEPKLKTRNVSCSSDELSPEVHHKQDRRSSMRSRVMRASLKKNQNCCEDEKNSDIKTNDESRERSDTY